MTDFSSNFSYYIQIGMAYKRIHPAELARKTNLSREMIRQYQFGLSAPQVENLCTISTILSIDHTLEDRFHELGCPSIPKKRPLNSNDTELLHQIISSGSSLLKHKLRFDCSYKVLLGHANDFARAKNYENYMDFKKNHGQERKKQNACFANTLIRISALDNITIREMAKKSDISLSSMYGYISENILPNSETFAKLITTLGIDHLRTP